MDYSITGVAYLALSFAIGSLIYRFFQYWKKEKDVVSKIWLYTVSVFGLFVFVKAIAGLFFATDSSFLKFTINFGVFLQVFALALMSYFSVYIKLSPKISPWLGFIPVFILGMVTTYLTVLTPQNPFLEPSGAINWGLPLAPNLAVNLRIFLFLFAFIPAVFILFEQFQKAQDPYTKRKSLGFILLFAVGIMGALLDFVLGGFLKLDAIWRDIVLIFGSIVIFIAFFPSRKDKLVKND
jgi:hypothetical protein